jgi:archaeal chaperonin
MAYLTTTGSGQPVLILKEGTTRSRGKEAQRNNIMAARVVGEVLKTTLGPRGMDKMLIDNLGDITITNDGATILNEIEVEHPAAKMMVEIAKTQDDMVGDGTTTAVVLASELLKKAEELLDQNIHPTILVSGYRKAASKSNRSHRESLSTNRRKRQKAMLQSSTNIYGQQSSRRRKRSPWQKYP